MIREILWHYTKYERKSRRAQSNHCQSQSLRNIYSERRRYTEGQRDRGERERKRARLGEGGSERGRDIERKRETKRE